MALNFKTVSDPGSRALRDATLTLVRRKAEGSPIAGILP